MECKLIVICTSPVETNAVVIKNLRVAVPVYVNLLLEVCVKLDKVPAVVVPATFTKVPVVAIVVAVMLEI